MLLIEELPENQRFLYAFKATLPGSRLTPWPRDFCAFSAKLNSWQQIRFRLLQFGLFNENFLRICTRLAFCCLNGNIEFNAFYSLSMVGKWRKKTPESFTEGIAMEKSASALSDKRFVFIIKIRTFDNISVFFCHSYYPFRSQNKCERLPFFRIQ